MFSPKNQQLLISPVIGLLLFLGLVCTAAPTFADDLTGRWGFGFETGVMKLTEGYWDYSILDLHGNLTVNRGLSPHWNLHGNLKYGQTRPGVTMPGEEVGWGFDATEALYTIIWQPTISLQYRFSPHSRISPWLGGGLGLTSWKVMDKTGESNLGWFPGGEAISGYDINGNEAELKGTDLTISLELGTDIFLSDRLALNLGGRYHLMPGNEIDNIGMSTIWGSEHVDANTAMVEGIVGLTWWFGGTDSDNDGIANKYDSCPDQPEDMDGFNDLDGCPEIDNDQDGILDGDDRCPNDPEDMDGFKDTDGCPDPDNDEDGIVDGRDQCPDEAEDLDGFQDEDGCPDPDNDGDGILDGDDNCPDTPAGAEVDEFGCAIVVSTPSPTVAPKPVALPPADILEGVNFASGSADLLPESIDVLLELAFTLQENPTRRIEVRGHTDATGVRANNLDLSQRRAQSVRDALIDMGVAPGRITAVGYGQDFPIADNGTRGGRAMNRRVEVYNLP